MPSSSRNSQPTSFLWGVATSGYQSEGGYNGPEQPQNNWAESERRKQVMTTGAAVEFWTRYTADFQRCRDLGLNAFRLSIEWARVQPSTQPGAAPAPEFDTAALDAYGDRIAACRQAGLEPIVTLQHFTHPAWLGLDAWLSVDTIEAFIQYVQTAVQHINQRLTEHHQLPPIHWYITVNEPNILVSNTYLKGDFPGAARGISASLRAYNHLLSAHVRAYNCIHDIYEAAGWSRPQVSLNTYCSDLYWSEKVIWDLLSLRQRDVPFANLREYVYGHAKDLEAALRQVNLPRSDLSNLLGRFLHRVADWLGHRYFDQKAMAQFLQTLAESARPAVFDFIGLDYYDPFLAHTFRLPSFSDFEFATHDFRDWLMSGISSKWWDWRSLPEGLHFFCQYYSHRFDQCPILIAENGMALRRKPDNSIATHRLDKLRRSDFLAAHVQQVERLRQEGVPLVGYFHWSLTDNYEWGSFTPRFGLFAIDFTRDRDRHLTDHLGDCPSETYAQLIRASCPEPKRDRTP